MHKFGLLIAFSVIFLFGSKQAFAQPFVCVPKDASKLLIAGAPLPPPTGTLLQITSNDCLGFALFDPSGKLNKVRLGDTLVVYFDDGQKTVKDAGLNLVRVTIGTDTHDYTLASGTGGGDDWHYFRLTLANGDFPNASNGQLVKIQISATNVASTIWNLRLVQPISLYGVGNTHVGVWFPVALFSTDFKSNADGVTFAPMPVGIAVGVKAQVTNDVYLGLSGVGNWLISAAKDTNGNTTGNVNFAGLTVGALLDVDNLFYLGYAYGLDLTSVHQNPGSLFVFGVAPGLLQLLQSKP